MKRIKLMKMITATEIVNTSDVWPRFVESMVESTIIWINITTIPLLAVPSMKSDVKFVSASLKEEMKPNISSLTGAE
jgi:hypothetical protein